MTDLQSERATDYLGRLVEEITDHGDGTGTLVRYAYEGESRTPSSSSSSTIGRPLPEQTPESDSDRIARLEQQVEELSSRLGEEPPP